MNHLKSPAMVPKTVNGQLYRSAFLNSGQPKLIVGPDGRIVSANHAACAMLGYTRKQFVLLNRFQLFDIPDDEFCNIGFLRTDGGAMESTYNAIGKDGNRIACYLKCVPFLDQNEPSIIMAFSPVSDVTRATLLSAAALLTKHAPEVDTDGLEQMAVALHQADSLLAQSYEMKKSIGKISYDIMWDWNLVTDRVDVGDSVFELFGFNLKGRTLSFKTFAKCLLPRERDRVRNKMEAALKSGKTGWSDSCMVVRKDGSVAFTLSRAKILRDKDGKATHVIGATQDVSRLHELEQQLRDQVGIQEELSEIFEVASSLSFDGRWDWNLNTNEFFFGSGFQALFGYDVNAKAGNTVLDWSMHLHPDDRSTVERDLQRVIQSTADYWEHAYRFIKADGSFARVFNRASIIRNVRGKAIRMIGVMQDVSKQQMLEEKLAQEIKLKDKKIAEAQQEAKEMERSDIGKELHDNVNQLLGASRMYMDMAKRGGADRDNMIARSSEFTLTAIEEIRKLTKGLTSDFINHIGLKEAIENLCSDTMKASDVNICCLLESISDADGSSKFKINLFRIIQEQLTNILKHAGASEVTVCLRRDSDNFTLTIQDDGVGFDPKMMRKGIGVDNIISRAGAFAGTAEFSSAVGEGCTLTVIIPGNQVT